jgi:hypothetical protein
VVSKIQFSCPQTAEAPAIVLQVETGSLGLHEVAIGSDGNQLPVFPISKD